MSFLETQKNGWYSLVNLNHIYRINLLKVDFGWIVRTSLNLVIFFCISRLLGEFSFETVLSPMSLLATKRIVLIALQMLRIFSAGRCYRCRVPVWRAHVSRSDFWFPGDRKGHVLYIKDGGRYEDSLFDKRQWVLQGEGWYS